MKKENKDLNLKDLKPKDWRPIPGFDSRYLINREGVTISVLDRPGHSTHGRVKKLKNQNIGNDSKMQICLITLDNKRTSIFVATLVMMVWGKYKPLRILFKDGNCKNHSFYNLEYITPPNFKSKTEIWKRITIEDRHLVISSSGLVYIEPFTDLSGKVRVGHYMKFNYTKDNSNTYLAFVSRFNGRMKSLYLKALMEKYFKPEEYDWDKISAYYAKLLK